VIILRRLTESGIQEFRTFLAALRVESRTPVPEYLLEAPGMSEVIPTAPTLDRRFFKTKREAATYLHGVLKPLGLDDLMRDQGLWSWLALLYFDSVCPADSSLRRKVRADAHYILNPDHRRIYRHLLRTPYHIIDSIPRFNRIFLEQPLSVHGELIEQVVGGRLFLIRIPAVAEAVDRLYFDHDKGKPKPQITSARRRGNFRSRLPLRVQQLSLTYDVAGMSADQLIESLGEEFTGWLAVNPLEK
jgi:hypothetical protein